MLDPIKLSGSDLAFRPLGVGTNSWGPSTLEGARDALAASLEAGIELVDTAEVYGFGGSERVIGEILPEPGGGAFVATKFAPFPWRLGSSSWRRALTASLERLGLERVGLYQVHWPFSISSIETLMDWLADEVAEGRVGAVGVSNYNAEQTRRAHAALAKRGVPLASNQVNYSLLHRAPQVNGVLDTCRELGAVLIAYTPLASGALTGKYRPGALPSGARRFMPAFRRLAEITPLTEELQAIGRAHARSAAQVALNWLARQEGVLPIPGAKNARQATDNAQAIDFEISDSEATRLDEASRRWR